MSKEKFDLSNRLYGLLVGLGVAFAVLVVFVGMGLWQSWSGDYPREIAVEGSGTAYVTPDVAKVTIGMDIVKDTADAAVAEDAAVLQAVMKELAVLGVAKEDVQNTYYNVGPNYEWNERDGSSTQNGFRLDHDLTITVRDLNLVSQVIAKSTASGANAVSGVYFEVEDMDEAKKEAREKALANAKEKADLIAEQSGLRLGKVLNYYEYSNDAYGKGGYYDQGLMMAESAVSGAPEPVVEPGRQEINLTVSLTYRVK